MEEACEEQYPSFFSHKSSNKVFSDNFTFLKEFCLLQASADIFLESLSTFSNLVF